MPGPRDDHVAAMYFIAGVRRAFASIDHDPALFGEIASAMEQNAARIPEEHRVSLHTAARWMRHLRAAGTH